MVALQRLQEFVDLALHFFRFFRQTVGRFQNLSRRMTAFAGVGTHLSDVAGDLLRAVRGFLNVAADFTGCRPLFLDGGADRAGDVVNLVDRLADTGNGATASFVAA